MSNNSLCWGIVNFRSFLLYSNTNLIWSYIILSYFSCRMSVISSIFWSPRGLHLFTLNYASEFFLWNLARVLYYFSRMFGMANLSRDKWKSHGSPKKRSSDGTTDTLWPKSWSGGDSWKHQNGADKPPRSVLLIEKQNHDWNRLKKQNKTNLISFRLQINWAHTKTTRLFWYVQNFAVLRSVLFNLSNAKLKFGVRIIVGVMGGHNHIFVCQSRQGFWWKWMKFPRMKSRDRKKVQHVEK